jgi:transglutaminase-like putative cysteine protease
MELPGGAVLLEQEVSWGRSSGLRGLVLRVALAGLACLGSPLALAAPRDEFVIEPVPEWIVAIEPGSSSSVPLEQISDGTYYLLSDSQVNLAAGAQQHYLRIASVAVNPNGVDRIANIEIRFDPAYETLALHRIDVVRDGRRISKLQAANIRVLQREPELERRVYDGSKTANVFLEDVRVGDVVDYAYTLRGSNPVFGGMAFGTFKLRYGEPVARIHARLLAPASVKLTIAPRNAAAQPEIATADGARDYRWRLDGVAPLVAERDEPVWYDAAPAVQWGVYADWSAVARWAVPLYAIPHRIGSPLQGEVERIAAAHAEPALRMLAALRLVQREIRYLGVSIGAGSHAPNSPDLVFERRFGDCKDKTLLLLTLLDRLGIEARAALVNTGLLRGLSGRHASPGQFDHVVVRARLGGQDYWLDPTRAVQNADLQHLVQADYQLALVVDPATQGLSGMQRKDATSRRHVRATFDARKGFDRPVAFSVVTTVSGGAAESLRNTLSSTNRAELSKDYVNFYASYYPGIVISAPLAVSDDERRNRITTTERYTIAKLSEWSESEQRFNAPISAPDVAELLRAPASAVRSAPLWQSHPLDVSVETEALLPEQWPIKAQTVKVADPAFSFERTIEPGGARLRIVDHFRSLSDEVPAAQAQRYAENLAKARESIGYALYWDAPGADALPATELDRVNWLIVAIAGLAFGLWMGLALLLWRHDPPAAATPLPSGPRGLGGWLVLPLLGLLLTPLVVAATLFENAGVWSTESWAGLTTFGGAAYHAMWAPALLFELIAQLGVVVASILLLALFFRRRSSAPRVYIGFMILVPLVSGISLFMQGAIPALPIEAKDISDLVRSCVSSVIWIAYFLASQRVRNTFVERRRKAPPVAEPPPAVGDLSPTTE